MKHVVSAILSLSSLLIFCLACASTPSSRLGGPAGPRLYRWQDASGLAYWRREVGMDTQKHLVAKSLLYTPDLGPEQAVEKAIIFSTVGQIHGHPVLRPWRAQYRVWLEGQEYFSEQQLDLARRKMMLHLRSPQAAWNGIQEVAFPAGKIFCYVGQLTECLKEQGFLGKAIQRRTGRLNLHLIWESYPFVQEQYPAINQLFTPAVVEYDGELGPGLPRFSVSFAGQVFFLVVNERGQLEKFFWVAQGITVEALDSLGQDSAAIVEAPSPHVSSANTSSSLPSASSSPASSSSSTTFAAPPAVTPSPGLRKLRWVGNPADGNLGPSGR